MHRKMLTKLLLDPNLRNNICNNIKITVDDDMINPYFSNFIICAYTEIGMS